MKRVRLAAVILAVIMATQVIAGCAKPVEDDFKKSGELAKNLPDEQLIDEIDDEIVLDETDHIDEDELDEDEIDEGDIDASGILSDLNHTEYPVVVLSEGMKTFGAEGYGFIELPDNWIDYSEEYIDFEYNTIEFGDPSGINSITLAYIDNQGLTVDDMIDQILRHMESRDGESITTIMSSLNGIDVLVSYCLFPDTFTGLTIWTFVVEDGYIHNIFAEGSMLVLLDMIVYIEASYRYEV